MRGAIRKRAVARAAAARGSAAALALVLAILPTLAGAADVRVLTTADGLPSNWVTALASAPDGRLWVGTGNAGVAVVDPRRGVVGVHQVPDGLSSNEVTSIARFKGKVYVGTAAGISVLDEGRWETISRVENVTLRNVRLASSPEGEELWACSVYIAGGTVRFDGGTWEFMGGEGRGLFHDVQGFAFLGDAVLLGSGSGVPYLRKGKEVSPLREGLPPLHVFSAGARGGRWLLGTSRGLMEYDGAWKKIALPEGFGGASVFAIAARGEGVVLGTDRGLVTLSGGRSATLTPDDGLPASRVTAVAVAGELIAAGTPRGLALVR